MSQDKHLISLIEYFKIEPVDPKNILDAIENAFRNQRATINKQIIGEISNLKDLKKLNALHVSFLSHRQRLLEDSHILLDKLVDLKKEYKVNKGNAYNIVLKDMQLRIKTTGEKSAIIEGSTAVSESKAKIEVVENQILFYNESIKTVDQVLYGLKTRLDVERLLGVG